MPQLSAILDYIENLAPARYAYSWDKVGLQVGSPKHHISSAVVSLDWSTELVEFASQQNAELIVCHHPLIWEPLKNVISGSNSSGICYEIARRGMNFIAAHTNWDAAPGGINDTLAEQLDLLDIRPFGEGAENTEYKLVTFCPADSAEEIHQAVTTAGAGKIGEYSECSFRVVGHGTFLGSETSNPTIGIPGHMQSIEELRLEYRVKKHLLSRVIGALKNSHPYEEVAYDIYPLKDEVEQALGRIGETAHPLALKDFVRLVETQLTTKALAWGDPEKIVRRVAVVGGSADDFWREAQKAGADVLVTGEVKQHNAVASSPDVALISAGHFATEQPGCRVLRDRLSGQFPDVRWTLFEPSAGTSGRPF